MIPTCKAPDPNPRKPKYTPARRGVRCALPYLRAGRSVSVRSRIAPTRRRTRPSSDSRSCREPRARARGARQCELPRAGQHGDRRCDRPEWRPLSWRRQCRRLIHRTRLERLHAGGLPRRALQFRQASRRHARHGRVSARHRSASKPLGWHVVLHFDASDLVEFAPMLHAAAGALHHRSHGTRAYEGRAASRSRFSACSTSRVITRTAG